jgi:cbb3-type cytochrome oxidase subunit 1
MSTKKGKSGMSIIMLVGLVLGTQLFTPFFMGNRTTWVKFGRIVTLPILGDLIGLFGNPIVGIVSIVVGILFPPFANLIAGGITQILGWALLRWWFRANTGDIDEN